VLSHQEYFDGTGYPRSLKGEQIPLGARIFAVADALDAMISDRPYRKALVHHTRKGEMSAARGQQFDPEVVKVFLAMPDTLWNDCGKHGKALPAVPAEDCLERLEV